MELDEDKLLPLKFKRALDDDPRLAYEVILSLYYMKKYDELFFKKTTSS